MIYSSITHSPMVKFVFFGMHQVFDGILCHIYVVFTYRSHQMCNIPYIKSMQKRNKMLEMAE
jgi:hypothetical protein